MAGFADILRRRRALPALAAALALAVAAGFGVQALNDRANTRRELSASLLSLEANLQELHARGLETVSRDRPSVTQLAQLAALRNRGRQAQRRDRAGAGAPDPPC